MVETGHDRAALPPISFLVSLSLGRAAGSAAVAWQHRAGLRTAALANQRRPSEREAGWPSIPATRPAHGERDQILRLAQILLQDSRNKHGLPDHHQRYVRNGSIRRPHRPD